MRNDKQKENKMSSARYCAILLIFALAMPGMPLVFGARITGEEGVSTSAPQDHASGEARPETVVPPRPLPEAPPPPPPEATPTPLPPKATPTPPKKALPPPLPKKSPAGGRTVAVEKEKARFVNIDFNNVDIALFIKFMSELTGKNFVIDDKVKGKVTIVSPKKISVKEAYKVFESVLEVHGFTAVPAGEIIKIVPALDARSKSIETRLKKERIDTEDKVVTQLIPLEYANPDELKKLFTPLVSKTSLIISYPPTRMLILTDVLSNIERVLKIVKTIDVIGVGEEITVIPVEHADVSNLAKSLTAVFAGARTKKKTGQRITPVKIVPDERTNVLIVFGTEDETRKIRRLIELLDKPTPAGERDIHVYYLQNANAEELAGVLTTLPEKQGQGPAKGKAPVISKEAQIVADKATNSLVIMAGKDDFTVLENVIKKLDIPRKMVYIEALIMEVSMTKSFDIGVRWHAADEIGSYGGKDVAGFIGNNPGDVGYPGVDTTGTGVLPDGFALGVLGDKISIAGIEFLSIGAVIRAYKKDSDVQILATPQIMTSDNEEAEITVGKNVPYITRRDTSAAGSSVDYSNYEYKDVGFTLIVTPQINQKRFVRLQLSQQVTQVIPEESQVDRPTTLKRVAKTTVIVRDGNTIVIGGLIGTSLNDATYTVPCLGDIPGLGWLFKSVSTLEEKTNLFIFLTPHIVENPAEAAVIYDKKKEEIDSIEEGVIKMYEKEDL
jgi:general secretion pathway protein D